MKGLTIIFPVLFLISMALYAAGINIKPISMYMAGFFYFINAHIIIKGANLFIFNPRHQ